jgi:hypothetical protein
LNIVPWTFNLLCVKVQDFCLREHHFAVKKSKKCPWDNIQIYNAKYWQKMRDFIDLYHSEVIIQLWV